MLNKLNDTRAIAVATLTAICMMAGIARAEHSESSEMVFVDVAYIPGDNHGYAAVDCKELRETAWFLGELARTDGDTTPEVAQPACRPDIIAESTVDAD